MFHKRSIFFVRFIPKLFLFFMLSAFFLQRGFAQSPLDPVSPVQKLAQTPKDRPIKVVTQGNNRLCYIPTFSAAAAHNSYIGLLNCADTNARSARYDVFGRLAYQMDNTWLCITAPDSVAVQRQGKDYLYLSPCVINLKSQQWKIKDGVFYSTDGEYSIKDDGSFLFAVHRLEGGLFTHRLDSSMQEWANTIATPGNISLVSSISWTLTHKDGQERYFLTNNQSLKNTTPLYYNVANGHIATYDSLSGTLSCMYSNTGKQSWDWVTWGLCTDAKPPKNNRAFFKPVPIGERNYIFLDQNGNMLRLTRYGIHWGVPYTASAKYIQSDTANSPTSSFETDDAMRIWLRFIYANLGESLHSCPAPGHNQEQNQPQRLGLSPLPSDFNLSGEWIRRLYSIARSTDGTPQAVGICGTCLLHSYQALAEILENPYQPRTSGGYFFDTSPGISPFESFRRRNPLLHDTLRDIFSYYDYPRSDYLTSFRLEAGRGVASNISMLPQYDWTMLGEGTSVRAMTDLMQSMFNRPVGSVFLMNIWRLNTEGNRIIGHAMPALRTSRGIVIIPTNTPYTSLESFRLLIAPVQNAAGVLANITRFGTSFLTLMGLRVFEISRVYHNPFEEIISFNNCAGEGEDRRGNALLPLPELLNQCMSGRCEW